jgi:beta-glucosidase
VLPQSVLGVSALVQAFNPGMRGGRAIAELLLGEFEPSGRLPISAARHVGQQPVYYNQLRGQHGDRYADLTQDPLFVFGEGLSYTTVEYADPVIEQPRVGVDGTVRATVRLTNTGGRPALETVQAYVSDLVTSVTWADRELKAYRQVTVPPGGSVEVVIEVPASACTLVTADGRRVVEPGDFELRIGPNSRDLRTASFRIG